MVLAAANDPATGHNVRKTKQWLINSGLVTPPPAGVGNVGNVIRNPGLAPQRKRGRGRPRTGPFSHIDIDLTESNASGTDSSVVPSQSPNAPAAPVPRPRPRLPNSSALGGPAAAPPSAPGLRIIDPRQGPPPQANTPEPETETETKPEPHALEIDLLKAGIAPDIVHAYMRQDTNAAFINAHTESGTFANAGEEET